MGAPLNSCTCARAAAHLRHAPLRRYFREFATAPPVYEVRLSANSFSLPHSNLLHYEIDRKTVSLEISNT